MDLSPGDVWWARPDPSVGREQSGRRPVIVVSSPLHLRVVDTLVLVVPVTTRDRRWPNHVPLSGGAGLDTTGYVMTEQLRVISRERLVRRAGAVDHRCLRDIAEWIADFTVVDPSQLPPA